MIVNKNLNTKLVNATYNEKSGISTVTLENEYGRFTGVARCHPDDKGSKFFGCQIAEARAMIKIFKEQLRISEGQRKVFDIFIDTISQKKDYNPKTNEACHARRFLEEFELNNKYFSESIKAAENYINDMINSLDKDQERVNKILKKKAEIE